MRRYLPTVMVTAGSVNLHTVGGKAVAGDLRHGRIARPGLVVADVLRLQLTQPCRDTNGPLEGCHWPHAKSVLLR